jgi:hypothetical protein
VVWGRILEADCGSEKKWVWILDCVVRLDGNYNTQIGEMISVFLESDERSRTTKILNYKTKFYMFIQ